VSTAALGCLGGENRYAGLLSIRHLVGVGRAEHALRRIRIDVIPRPEHIPGAAIVLAVDSGTASRRNGAQARAVQMPEIQVRRAQRRESVAADPGQCQGRMGLECSAEGMLVAYCKLRRGIVFRAWQNRP
jgi:hypothetical protein